MQDGTQESSRLCQSTTDQTLGISASMQEQLASIEEISSSGQMLAKLAEELQTTTRKFKL